VGSAHGLQTIMCNLHRDKCAKCSKRSRYNISRTAAAYLLGEEGGGGGDCTVGMGGGEEDKGMREREYAGAGGGRG
jgi:hypothetical protein